MASLLDKLLGAVSQQGSVRMMGKTLAVAPVVLASASGHDVADVDHLVDVLLALADVQKALAARGVVIADARAFVEELLDERPASELATKPRTAARLEAALQSSSRAEHATRALCLGLASHLPPELGFLRRPFEQSADEIAETYDGALSSKKGLLTFDAWDEELRVCVSRMQHRADKSEQTWWLNTYAFFVQIVTLERMVDSLEQRGIEWKSWFREMTAAVKASGGRRLATRAPPAGHVAGVSPGLFAVFLRAERYAAADASNVRLRHALLALHDEPALAPFVAKLAGS